VLPRNGARDEPNHGELRKFGLSLRHHRDGGHLQGRHSCALRPVDHAAASGTPYSPTHLIHCPFGQIEEVEFVGDKAKTEKEEQRGILLDLLRLLAGSLNLTPVRSHFAHSTNFTPFVNELLAFLLDPEPNSNQLFAEDQMIKNAITELLCVIAKCDQGILTVQKFRSDFKKTQSAIAEFIFNVDRNPSDLQIAHFLKLFVLISTEGERASEFNEHFPISFIEKWSKSNCRELTQVVAILKNSSFVQSSCQ